MCTCIHNTATEVYSASTYLLTAYRFAWLLSDEGSVKRVRVDLVMYEELPVNMVGFRVISLTRSTGSARIPHITVTKATTEHICGKKMNFRRI